MLVQLWMEVLFSAQWLYLLEMWGWTIISLPIVNGNTKYLYEYDLLQNKWIFPSISVHRYDNTENTQKLIELSTLMEGSADSKVRQISQLYPFPNIHSKWFENNPNAYVSIS